MENMTQFLPTNSSSTDPPPLPTPSALNTTILLSTLTLLPLAYLIPKIRRSYQDFLALGPGGIPSTPTGYIHTSILQLFALRNPLSPPSLPPTLTPQHGILSSKNHLPIRSGPRPKVAGIAPHRQLTQKATSETYHSLTTLISTLSTTHPSLYLRTSCFEKHSTGLFTTTPQPNHRITCNGEICHAHPSDGSMHLTLHPEDVRYVIERGWGERHPLAREGWWWRKSVPSGFVLVYAPRDEGEVECVEEIIRAAVWWVGGKELGRES